MKNFGGVWREGNVNEYCLIANSLLSLQLN